MEFIKKHYEKVVFSLVLVGLTAALLFIPFRLNAVKQQLDELEASAKQGTKKPLKPVDLARGQRLLARMKDPKPIDLSRPHHLVSPVLWQKRTNADGTAIYIKVEKGNEAGPEALVINAIRPLYFSVSLERSTPQGATFVITREEAPAFVANYKSSVSRFFPAVGSKGDAPKWSGSQQWDPATPIALTLVEAKGPPEKPTEWVFERSDKPGEKISVTADKPYREVRDYAVDMTYPPENRQLTNYRENMQFILGADTNKVVDIQSDKVVLSEPNEKLTTLHYKP